MCLHIADMHLHVQNSYVIEYQSESMDLFVCENEPVKTVDECVCRVVIPCVYILITVIIMLNIQGFVHALHSLWIGMHLYEGFYI